ncbi:hypothetical protein CDL15_Pgr005053 [Punica granatum]|uniref:TFIIS central domain-containing protein n=2 Tax=Punica granatum TaxID=22663 RepID=A0A218W1U2_PUNGR|nr:hypothetical protein CDL15_Pgr005053 [Punica granatum]
MSNHLVSQPLSIPGTQTGQLEPVPNKIEVSMPVMPMGLMGLVPENHASQQLSASKQQMGFMVPVSKGFEVPKLSASGNNYGQVESREKVVGPQQHMVPSRPLEMVTMLNNQGSAQLSVLSKRKAPTEPTGGISPRSSSFPVKRAAQVEHRPWLLQQPVGSRKVMLPQSMQQAPGAKQLSAQTKKLAQMESISPKFASQRATTPKIQTSGQSSGKGESFESVRSKMRESLAGALALVSQERSKPLISVKNSQDDALFSQGSSSGSQPGTSNTTVINAVDRSFEEPKEALLSSEGSHDQKLIGDQMASREASDIENDGSPEMVAVSNTQDFQSDNTLSTDDVPFSDHFFVKDELLQGNGLSWVLESDIGVGETDAIQSIDGKDPVAEQVEKKEVTHSPEELASKIEAELYKLFGGVNKKYKEKGRSLLFNLKDRNNPELRERVLSGEILPERLCSMTAEELASKELSEWRMAKAEELAQMVVLPDSEVDVRRLVKKTHKGEFQVEVEQDDSVSEEVSLGGSSISRSRSITKEKETPQPKPNESKEENARGVKTGVVGKGTDYTLTIPSEGQESEVDIMVDDAMGDLPPIVSLDEFMESLDSEPPFEDLQVDKGKTESESPQTDAQPGSSLNSPDRSPKVAGDAVPEKSGKVDEALSTSGIDVKSNESPGKLAGPSPVISKDEQVWEGHLQLNISTTVPVIGGFKCGERTIAKEWSNIVEIKGRVRLDAFEKFLQDLRMSRSRAIMVVHFICKEGTSENERASICEVADSYVLDERTGFAEPSQGVELYFCPPHSRTREILGKILPDDQRHALDSVDSGLIGVVIWRRTQLTSTAAIKQHSSKKQHFPNSTTKSRQPQDKFDPNVTNPFQSSRFSHSTCTNPSYNVNGGGNDDDDEDDVPPGFGPAPGLSRDIDDLPEFNFSGGGGGSDSRLGRSLSQAGSHPALVPSRPVDQIRELIHKYGQSEADPGLGNEGIAVQPWNDDDDDIPEWQPQGRGQSFHTPNPHADAVNRRSAGHQFSQVARSVTTQQSASWSSPSVRGGQSFGPPQGRTTAWRQDGYRGRRGY